MDDKLSQTVLYLDGVNVSFDGFRALNNLSLVIEPGEMRAIIGPNGAGKTTMMDVITGKTKPDSGAVFFDGSVDLTRLDEASIASLGIGRKFQKPTVFESHTVRDNLVLALAGGREPTASIFGRESAGQSERIAELLRIIRLTDKAGWPASKLSHGQKQWLEIGMLLAQEPKLLLVDEPAAGMNPKETQEITELIAKLRTEAGYTILVIEHDMHVVEGISDRVVALDHGVKIAEGSFDTVATSPAVVEAYLGTGGMAKK